MFDWFRRRKAERELPQYSAVRLVPSRCLPPDLGEKETSESFRAQREAVERSLCESPQRPLDDSPLFVELLATDEGGVLTATLPESEDRCLPVFTTPYRAADYIRTLLTSGPRLQFLSSSPSEFVRMLADLRQAGIHWFAIDRCPRCDVFSTTNSESVITAEDAIVLWSISKATELARLDLYLDYAQVAARAGQFDLSRDVALETVAHVSLEDPRPHLLLGQIAVALQDQGLLREARTFLQFLNLRSWEDKLDKAIKSGSPDFEFVE